MWLISKSCSWSPVSFPHFTKSATLLTLATWVDYDKPIVNLWEWKKLIYVPLLYCLMCMFVSFSFFDWLMIMGLFAYLIIWIFLLANNNAIDIEGFLTVNCLKNHFLIDFGMYFMLKLFKVLCNIYVNLNLILLLHFTVRHLYNTAGTPFKKTKGVAQCCQILQLILH